MRNSWQDYRQKMTIFRVNHAKVETHLLCLLSQRERASPCATGTTIAREARRRTWSDASYLFFIKFAVCRISVAVLCSLTVLFHFFSNSAHDSLQYLAIVIKNER